MRTLSEVFAPGAPTLPEGLRTLVVSPERELEPGMTVRAAFTFRNQGGAPATGVRVRFNLPDGLVYLVGSGQLDGNDLDDDLGNSPLLARSGAHIGDVAPGDERRIELAYSVAGAIENGTTVELQAAVASFELAPVGSNVVRLVARSRPQLANALTNVTIEARQAPAPGSEAQVTVRLHNAGESSAHDVVVVAPIPEHAAYVPGSARVNGRELERDGSLPFDRRYAPTIVPVLAASASATLVFRVRIDRPLDDDTRIVASARVASQETPAFALEPSALIVRAAPDFGDDRTSFSVEPSHDVRPGQHVALAFEACNAGTAAAESAAVTLELPESLIPIRGASSIDGRPLRERRRDSLSFELGRIDAGDAVTLRCEAVVASPLPDGSTLEVAAQLAWQPGGESAERRFERSLAIRSLPALAARRNAIARTGSALAHPGDDVEATIAIANDGSAAAHDAVVHLRLDPALEEVRIFERSARVPLDGDTIELGTLDAYASRKLALRARIVAPYPDRGEVRVAAALHTRELGETPLGEALWTIDSHPLFDPVRSKLELPSDTALRPNQLADVDITLVNVGSDAAHNVRARLYVSPEARLETVDGAIREKSSLAFGEIAPGATASARLGLRLLRSLAKDYPVTIDAVLTADAMLPMPLERLTIVTTAEPDFSVGAFRSEPIDAVDVGETVEWVLHVRNGGDGPARRVHIAIAPPPSLIYVPNSTTVNDVPVRDVGALPPFSSERGLVLNDVDPGVEATVRWRAVVHNGLPAGETIHQTARVRYDGERVDDIASNELKVRAVPVFANAIPGLPFGLDGMLGPAFGAGQRALTEERVLQLPPATPVGDGAERTYPARAYAALSDGSTAAEPPGGDAAAAGIVDAALIGDGAGTALAFSAERLTRTLRFLDEARFDGLVTQLFALRAFLPDAFGDTHAGALAILRDGLRDELDRLFIKLRVPNYAIAARDVETPSLRATIERVIHDAAAARGVPSEPPTAAVVLRGTFDPRELAVLAERLHDADLATATPWATLARLLPDATAQFAHYRTLLVAALDDLADADAGEFLDALARRRDGVLDAALDVVRTALHVHAGP